MKLRKKTISRISLFLLSAVMIFNLSFGVKQSGNFVEVNNAEILNNSGEKIVVQFAPKAEAGFFGDILVVFNKTWNPSIGNAGDPAGAIVGAASGLASAVVGSASKKTAEVAGNAFIKGFEFILIHVVLPVMTTLVLYASDFLDMVTSVRFYDTLSSSNSDTVNSIYVAWSVVRDFLNLFFMLALLFSAFATVFQVEKFHLKKIIIMLTVMALLVNFSYPITLFIIDFSNSLMYFFMDIMSNNFSITQAGGEYGSLAAKITERTQFAKTAGKSAELTKVFLDIVFLFILFLTLFSYAFNLLIRFLAFVILLVLSPAGFALAFFPSTKSVADSWWNNLIKYAVLGPVMMFFLLLAVFFFEAGVTTDISQDPLSIVGSMTLFTIPIVFLWMGLMASQKFGGMASGVVMGMAKRTGNKIKTMTKRGAVGSLKGVAGLTGATAAYKGAKQGLTVKLIDPGRKKREMWQATVASATGDKHALNTAQAKAIDEAAKKIHISEDMSKTDLDNIVSSGNKYEQAAAIRELANRGQATKGQLAKMQSAFGETSTVFQQLVSKVKRYAPSAAFAHIKDENKRIEAMNTAVQSGQFDINNVNADTLGDKEFMEIVMENKALSTTDIKRLRDSSPHKDKALTKSLSKLADSRTDVNDKVDKLIQSAYFMQKGELHNSVDNNVAWKNEVFNGANKDTFARATEETVTNNITEITNNVNPGRYKDIVMNMGDSDAQRILNGEVATMPVPDNQNARAIQNIAQNDGYLKNIV